MPKASLGDHHLEWFRLIAEVRAKAAELPFLMDFVDELERLLEKSTLIDAERGALASRSQQLTRDQDAVKARARIVAAQLRAGIRTKFGYGSELLTGFGLRPRRRKISHIKEEEAGAALVATGVPDATASSSPPLGNGSPLEGDRRPSKGRRRPLKGGDSPS